MAKKAARDAGVLECGAAAPLGDDTRHRGGAKRGWARAPGDRVPGVKSVPKRRLGTRLQTTPSSRNRQENFLSFRSCTSERPCPGSCTALVVSGIAEVKLQKQAHSEVQLRNEGKGGREEPSPRDAEGTVGESATGKGGGGESAGARISPDRLRPLQAAILHSGWVRQASQACVQDDGVVGKLVAKVRLGRPLPTGTLGPGAGVNPPGKRQRASLQPGRTVHPPGKRRCALVQADFRI